MEEDGESREEIVSSLITLSETLCEKAMELHESESSKGKICIIQFCDWLLNYLI